MRKLNVQLTQKSNSSILPNKYYDKHYELMQSLKKQRAALLNINKFNKIDVARHIYSFQKANEEMYKRWQSVLIKRRDWYTSSEKYVGEDEKLDLNKKIFGNEYRQVLDK